MADIKDLYVEERPFLGLLADLIKKGKEVRLIHTKEPGPNFREDFCTLLLCCVALHGQALTLVGIGPAGLLGDETVSRPRCRCRRL